MTELIPLLRLERLSRQVRDRRLVDDVSFDVAAGDVLAVVGPSGSGKSSLLRLINRLDEPTDGAVFLAGQDTHRLPPRELRRRIGMVMQMPILFPGTVADNIAFGPRQRGESLVEDEIARLLIRVGLSGFAGRDAANLSGGEAQRVSLARALANEPEILLLDEPTSALDESAKAGVETLISEIIRDRELTCLLVTHDEAQALRLASRALVLERGRVVRLGPAREVLDSHA